MVVEEWECIAKVVVCRRWMKFRKKFAVVCIHKIPCAGVGFEHVVHIKTDNGTMGEWTVLSLLEVKGKVGSILSFLVVFSNLMRVMKTGWRTKH